MKAIPTLLSQPNDIHRQFLGGDDGPSTVIIVVVILVLAMGGRMLSSWIASRGQSRSGRPPITGPFGGTLCPKCGHPFAMHIWGFNLLVGKYDRCPHCRRWSLVRRQHYSLLQAAAEAFEEETAESEKQSQLSEEEKWRQQLDDSRFDDQPPSPSN